MTIAWTDLAIADLVEIRAFIGRDDREVARDVGRRIMESADRLIDFPESGREGDEPGTRELVIPTLPYILIYRVAPEHIEILKVWHHRQSRISRPG